ncbi:MAG: hypothetical protein HC782_03050 [Gammaproteobacteria bacterium]|nr:hypothetical protein [Gammaproteobacteria bacterium]
MNKKVVVRVAARGYVDGRYIGEEKEVIESVDPSGRGKRGRGKSAGARGGRSGTKHNAARTSVLGVLGGMIAAIVLVVVVVVIVVVTALAILVTAQLLHVAADRQAALAMRQVMLVRLVRKAIAKQDHHVVAAAMASWSKQSTWASTSSTRRAK